MLRLYLDVYYNVRGRDCYIESYVPSGRKFVILPCFFVETEVRYGIPYGAILNHGLQVTSTRNLNYTT